jgi:GR25 family glycosyltransferase involved in LPS biosynthesis
MENNDSYDLINALLEKNKLKKIKKIKINESINNNPNRNIDESISYISYKKIKKTLKNILQNVVYMKKIKELTNYEVNNINIEISEDIINNKNEKIIISLTTIPTRFILDDFDIIIESMINQVLPPDYIIINICNQYKRYFEYDDIKYNTKLTNFCSNYKNVYINKCTDYGPATKLLGLCEFKQIKINPDDIIIIADDDLIYKPNMTYHYSMVYQLYQCDCIGITEEKVAPWLNNNIKNNHKHIYYDNYDTYLYGWLTWSIKYKNIDDLLEYYNEIIKLDENIWKHDDLIFTMYYKKKQLYTCGINLFFLEKHMNEIDGLKFDNMNNDNYRKTLETTYFQKNTKQIYKINKNIKERYLLYNIQNINYLPENINYNEKHIDIKYINNNTFALTLTSYNNNDRRIYKIDNNNIYLEAKYNKQTFFYNSNILLIKEDHYHINYNIFQTSLSNTISLNKLYSICSILSNIPSCEYVFFDDNDIITYINENYPKCINLYNNIIAGAYKADFFRLLYAYDNGGIYFDCKQILFSKESILFNYENLFTEDVENNGIYNAFFMTEQHNKKLYNIIIQCIDNLMKTGYFESSLSITGPQLWKKYINKNDCNFKNILFTPETYSEIKDRFLYSYIIDKNTNQIMIKNSYYGYYDENNYLLTNHYSNLWNLKQVYHKHINNEYYNKINGIDYILWINLDRSDKRRNLMENHLKYINIPSIRISGIDGKNNKLENITNVINNKMSIYEHCCLFSHLKAILNASQLNGDNFLILEDDAVFDNFIYFDSLKEIIANAPEFDILMIYKTTEKCLIDLYTKRINNDYVGTIAYIINKKGINKITKLFDYNIENNKFTFIENNISEADRYIYNNTITYIYKYNLIYETSNDSTIHSENLPLHKKVLEIDKKNIINDNLIYYLPKIIFCYWDKYEENDIIKAHIQNWKNKISNEWRIIILNKNNLSNYVDIQFINKYINLDSTRFSDFLRLYLLIKYGGVWMDAGIIILNGQFLDNYFNEMINGKYDVCLYENKKESVDYPHLDNWFFMAPKNSNYLYDLYYEFNKSYEMGFINYKNEILLKTNINFKYVFFKDDTYLMQHAIAKYLLYTNHTYNFNIKYASISMFYIQENNPAENIINIIINNNKLLSSLYAIKLTRDNRKYITSENKYIYINKILNL